MLRALTILSAVMLLCSNTHAAKCDLADEDNFPSTVCSVTSLGANFTQLRFGQIDEIFSGSNEGETILRSGTSIFVIDESSEILQEVLTDDDEVECDTVDLDDQLLDEEIAYILDGDSLNAPRKISRLWILGCEVSQPR